MVGAAVSAVKAQYLLVCVCVWGGSTVKSQDSYRDLEAISSVKGQHLCGDLGAVSAVKVPCPLEGNEIQL